MPSQAEVAAAAALAVWSDQMAAAREQIAQTAVDSALGTLGLAGTLLTTPVEARIRAGIPLATTRRAREAFYSESQSRARAARAAIASRQAQQAAADLTGAYLAERLRTLGLRRPTSRLPVRDQPRGVDPLEVWLRPAEQYRYRRSLGLEDGAALEAAAQRARALMLDDVDLAVRQATVDVLEDVPEVIGYRRVIHPERSEGGACGLCVAASTRVYDVESLMPMHNRCRCVPEPVLDDDDEDSPSRLLNAGEEARIYRDAGGTSSGRALKRQRYRVDQHGELGPVLVLAGSPRADARESVDALEAG